MTPNMRYVYVDTQYIHAFIFFNSIARPNEEKRFAKEQFNSILHRQDNFSLKIPMVAMGEIFNNIHRKDLTDQDNDDIIRQLLHMMSVDKVDIVPPKLECFEVTTDLLSRDNRLDNTDTLIVSQALCDPLSTYLLMKDQKVIRSAAIQDVNNELVENGTRLKPLNITPEIIKNK